jgi:hypothetical protein
MEKEIESDKLLSLLTAILGSSFEIINNFGELIRLKLMVVSKSIEMIFWLIGFVILLAISAWVIACVSMIVLLTQLGLSLQGALIAMLLIHLGMLGCCGFMISSYRSNINFKLMSPEVSENTRRNLV